MKEATIVSLLPGMTSRYGLSRIGVSVFLAGFKGDLAGLALLKEGNLKIDERILKRGMSASTGAIQHGHLELEEQGADQFSGESLYRQKLMQSLKMDPTFLRWLVLELYEDLPEAADLERLKFVFWQLYIF